MDEWRHLPNYQLERRADLFFSLYLPEVLSEKLGFPVLDRIIPEFPVRIGTIYPDIPIDKSYKLDYVALAADAGKAILVELKTEGMSRRDKQDNYLQAACDVGFKALVEGVIEIFCATNAKRKYFVLLDLMESMELIRIPKELRTIMSRRHLQGATEASRLIEVTACPATSLIVYIQPNSEGDRIISFEEFRGVVQRYDDPVSSRFAKSLSEWAEIKAGEKC